LNRGTADGGRQGRASRGLTPRRRVCGLYGRGRPVQSVTNAIWHDLLKAGCYRMNDTTKREAMQEEEIVAYWSERIRQATADARPLRLRGAGTKDWYGQQLQGEILDTREYRG